MLAWLLLLVTLSFASVDAHAHAILLASAPPDGAVIAAAPPSLQLRFNEAVTVTTLRLVDHEGQNRLEPWQPVSGQTIDVDTPARLDNGRYLLSYRVVSADGHPIGGTIAFQIGAVVGPPAAADPAPDEARDRVWRAAGAVDRAVSYAMLLLASGNALFVLLIQPALAADRRCRRQRLLWAAIGAAAIVLAVPLEGAALSGSDAAGLIEYQTWLAGWATTVGSATAITLMGLVLLALASAAGERSVRFLLAGGTLAVIAGFGVTGHAATAAPRALMIPTVCAHALVAAFWIGSLPPLLQTFAGSESRVAAQVIRRFSAWAAVAVTLLLVAGTILAFVQFGGAEGLATPYGLIFFAKLAAVCAMLALAAVNKWHLAPSLIVLARAQHAASRLLLTIKAELVIGILVIAATAWLGATSPPRIFKAAALSQNQTDGPAQGYTTVVSSGRYAVHLEVTPARAGDNRLRLWLEERASAQAVVPREIELDLSNPGAGIEPLVRATRREADGTFSMAGPELSLPGAWIIRVGALVSDFERVNVTIEVPVK